MGTFELGGTLRRIRRIADLSQRELAERLDMSKSTIAAAESGARGLDARVLSRAAALAGLRIALTDSEGVEVPAMSEQTVRDGGWRHFPAHLDTLYSEERWSHYAHRPHRAVPWYTFFRDRDVRDRDRQVGGTPADHQTPQPGDSPADRKAARRAAARRRWEEELERRRQAGELPEPEEWTCCCPPACDELDIGERPVHAPDCRCGCDIG